MKPGGVQNEEEDDEEDFASLMPNLASLAVQDVDEFGETGETEIVNSDGDDCADTARTEIVLPEASPTVQVEPLRPPEEPLFSATYTRRRKVAKKRDNLGGGERARRSLYAGRVGQGGKKALPRGEHSFLDFAEAGQKNVLQEVQNFFDHRGESNQQRQRKVKVRSRRSLTRAKRKSAGNFQICFDADENEVARWDEEKLVEEDDRQEFCFQRPSCGEREKSSLPVNSSMPNTGDVQLGRGFCANHPEQCEGPVPEAREAGNCGGTGDILQQLDGLGSDVDMDLCFGRPFELEYSIRGKRRSADLLDSNSIFFSPAEDLQAVDEVEVHFGDDNDAPMTLSPAGDMPGVEGLQVHVGDSMDVSMTLPPAVDMPELELQDDRAAGEESGVSSGGHGDEFRLHTDNKKDAPTTFSPAEAMLGVQASEDQIGDSTDVPTTLPSAVDMPEVEELQADQGAGDESGVNAPHAEPGLTPVHREGQVGTFTPEVHRLEATGTSPPPADELIDLQDVPDRQTSCNHNYIDKQSPASSENQPGRSKSKRKRRRMEVDRRKSLVGAGTKWEDGLRRSTRIRVPPVEWWNNEKLLYGRVSSTLCTLVGIKKLLPATPPVGRRRQKEKPQKFEITSFVSPKWKSLVEFVAL